ncbi:Protein of unknown function [Caballeronia arationis]|uniref:DUF2591 domain-containing protein n=1 Tax=Caballeronia arationis TaxID=1777142 RepID=A0A7Z7N5C7_9BURK|nr:phage protein NinX family protein [Caballeronia arationis]SOE82078.1 Protein of unknown function [Caballeronia arationis]
MEVKELRSGLLDYWVARAEGIMLLEGQEYSPSTDWSVGGPIIDKHEIGISPLRGTWFAAGVEASYELQEGDTALIAAMRFRVAKTYGRDVPDVEN